MTEDMRERFETLARSLGLALHFAWEQGRGYIDPDTWKAFAIFKAALSSAGTSDAMKNKAPIGTYCCQFCHTESPIDRVSAERCPECGCKFSDDLGLCTGCGLPVGKAQTEGGEKPPRKVRRTIAEMKANGITAEDFEGVSTPANTALQLEPSSPPATAGTAREFRDVQCFQENQWDDERAEAYADQRADDTIVSLNRRLAEVLEAKVALATEVAQLRQERDALRKELDATTNSN